MVMKWAEVNSNHYGWYIFQKQNTVQCYRCATLCVLLHITPQAAIQLDNKAPLNVTTHIPQTYTYSGQPCPGRQAEGGTASR